MINDLPLIQSRALAHHTTGALQTRERKKMLDHGHEDGHGNGGGDELEAEEAGEVLEDEHKSVFFDPTKGLWKCRHRDWTYRLSSPCKNDILNHQGYCHQIEWDLESLVHNESFYGSPNKVPDLVNEVSAKYVITEVMQFGAQKENGNETSNPKGKELEAQENVNAQEINHSSNNDKLENGSHSNGSHEISNSSETAAIANGHSVTTDKSNFMTMSNGRMSTTNVDAIQVDKDEHVTEGKLNIEEYDLEKILDEQETHDLYCPNCNSCITRRVILRKRKRTARPIRDEPPKKPHTSEPSTTAPSQTVPERQEQKSPDVFRCLSCFSFFIPTGCGFNIFRIFGRTEVNPDVQVQHPSASGEMPQSENCGTWLLSCFQSGDSPKKADADSAKMPPFSHTQSSNYTTTSAAASTSSVHSHGTIVKPEQPKKPLLAESSSQFQTTTTTTSTTTSSSINTSSQTSSATGFFQTEETQVITGQQVEVHDYKVHPPKPAGETVTDATHLPDKEGAQETTLPTTENGSLFSPPIPTSGFSEITSDTTIVSGIISRDDKPISPIPQAVGPADSPHLTLPVSNDAITETLAPRSDQRDEWDILKAIVYGGLIESVTSLSIVSAAAASGAKTLDIFILGLASLIGGLPLIFHNITDLRNCGDVDGNDERVGHYWLQLGRRSKFRLHMVMALISYILFGLLPPVLYGLSFRKSDNRENKMMAVAAASLACIALLALAKAHVKRPRTYFKTLMYYLTVGVSSSGLSYVAGELITRLLVHFGLIEEGASAPPGLSFPYAVGAETSAWASF